VEGRLEVCTYVMENKAKYCRSASRIKGSKKRGVMIGVLVGCSRGERRRNSTTRSTRKPSIPASLLCEVHAVVIFGILVEFVA